MSTTFHWTKLFVALAASAAFASLVAALAVASGTKPGGAAVAVAKFEGIEVIRTPIQAPNADAFAERWVRTVRSDCLDRILILGRRHLERVLRVYSNHYNGHRPHRAFQLAPPNGTNPDFVGRNSAASGVYRHDLLGELIHEYRHAA